MIIFNIKFMLITYITKKDIFKTINPKKKKKKKFNQSMYEKPSREIWVHSYYTCEKINILQFTFIHHHFLMQILTMDLSSKTVKVL